jgi:hypothetical protein
VDDVVDGKNNTKTREKNLTWHPLIGDIFFYSTTSSKLLAITDRAPKQVHPDFFLLRPLLLSLCFVSVLWLLSKHVQQR